MRAGIYANVTRDDGLQVTRELSERLCAAGIETVFHKANAVVCGQTFDLFDAPDLDVMITIGGDGTILRIVNFCAERKVPILGVNMGHVGFLTEFEPGSIGRIPELLLTRRYDLDERSLLEISFDQKTFYGLNEVVLTRQGNRMLDIQAEVGGKLIDRYRLDGIILSTPTGSTAYSLSAGGPVMAPNSDAFALTPINSHSLHSRPIILSDEEMVTLTKLGGGAALVVVDGNEVGEASTPVSVRKADRRAAFVRDKGSNFYAKLLSKLNKWSITE